MRTFETIKIFNANDIPFGKLSNNHRMLLEIDDKKYNSVTNYIYSNAIPFSVFKFLLQNMNAKDVSKEFNKILDTEIVSVSYTAIKNAVEELINTNEKFRDALFATGNSHIFYNSDNKLLGIKNGKGENLAGKIMEQLRNYNINKYEEEKLEKRDTELLKKIRKNYAAYMILKNLIRNGNPLKDFFGSNADDIIRKYTKSERDIFPIEIIQGMFKRKQIPEFIISSVADFDVIVHQLRKENLRSVREYMKEEYKNVAFDAYISEMLKRNYENFTNEETEKALSTIYLITDKKVLNLMKDKILFLYKKSVSTVKMFSDSMLNAMYKKIHEHKFYSPSQREIDDAEAYVSPSFRYSSTGELTTVITDYSKPFVIPSAGNSLSLEHTSVSIDGLLYPSVVHYMYAFLISSLVLSENIVDAHALLMINQTGNQYDFSNYVDLSSAKKIFHEKFHKKITFDIIRHMNVGLDKKFENEAMKKLLLVTGDLDLVWNDRDDFVLGTGKKGNGLNLVGKYMEKIREKIDRTERNVDYLNITSLLEDSAFIREWVRMRVTELLVNSYIIATKADVKIDSKFLRNIIDNLYDKCSSISEGMVDIYEKVPDFFEDIVRRVSMAVREENSPIRYDRFMENASDDVIKVTWRYIMVMLANVYSIANEKTESEMVKIIAYSENILSERYECRGKMKGELNRCIFSALINILFSLKQILETNFKLNEEHISLAVDILLNRKIIIRRESTELPERRFVQYMENVLPEQPYLEKLTHKQIRVESESDEPKETPKATMKEISDMLERLIIKETRGRAPPSGNDEYGETEFDDDDELPEFVYEDEEFGEKAEEEVLLSDEAEEVEEIEEKIEVLDESPELTNAVINYEILGQLNLIDARIDDAQKIVELIKKAVTEVATYKMTHSTKVNRINFFANTQKFAE